MRNLLTIGTFPFLLFAIVSIGCENQQPLIEGLKKEKAAVEAEMTKLAEKAKQMVAENEQLQSGLDAATKAAADAKTAADEALTAAKKQAEEAMAAAKKAEMSTAEALAAAKKEAADAIAKATADAKAKIAAATEAAKGPLAAAEAKAAELQKQLDTANAKIAELEAAAKDEGGSGEE